jgi:uncharacterized membrane protein
MRWPRFTILQLLLLAALCALVIGLATASWRSRPRQLQPQPAGRSRPAEAAILTIGLVAWGLSWGVVASRRQLERADMEAPTELKLVWGLFFAGGLVAVSVPVALLVFQGPLQWPGIYYAPIVGVALIVAAAGRRTHDLSRIAYIQMTNLVAGDWVNFVLGIVCHSLLRRPQVQGYLYRASKARVNESDLPEANEGAKGPAR